MKKHIRTVVALCMAAFMPVTYAQIPLVSDNSINRIIYSEDFESYSVGQNPDMLITYNAPYTTVEKSDAEYGKSLTFNCSDNMAAAKFFDEDLNRGVYRFSFDIKAESKGKSTVMRVYNRNLGKQMYSDSGMYQIFSYRDGNIGFYDPIHFWDAVSEAQYEVDEWNHIDMWFDMDNRKLYHYINGEYVRQVAINMDLDKLGGFLFAPEGKDAGSVMMDNFMLTEVKYADALGIPVEQIPEPLRGALDISVTSERVGHIFTKNEEAEFEVHLKNRTLEQQKGKVEATAFDSSGNVITSEAWNVGISGEGVSSHKMEITQKVFGCNTLVIKASIGETISQKTVEWSRINSDKNTPKNDKMGASVHYTDSKRDAINGIRLISEAGFGRVRDEILWKYYEPEKGYYKIPDNMDQFIDLSNDANLDTLMILSYGNPLYGGSPPETEAEYQGFYDYCYELVRDLKGRVNRFEIWNEFNLVGHHTFNPKKLPPENYAKLLVNSYKAVKRANPDAEVIGMVTSGSPLDWIEKVLIAIDGEKCFDAVSVHPYSLGVSSEDAHLVSKGKGLRELMNKYGYTDTRLYISEIGWTTDGDPQEEFNQAMYEVRTYLLNDAYDLYDAIYIYDFQDDSYLTEGSIEYTFGLVRYWNNMVENPFAAKPAYATLANFNALVGTAEFEKVIDVGEDAYAYVYEKDSKKTIAFGAYEDSEIISLKLGTETADVYDMYGNMHTVYGINGCYTLQAGEKIQYIQGDFSTAQVCEPVWSLSDTKIKTTANSRIPFTITKSFDSGAELDITVSDDLKIKNYEGFLGSTAELEISSTSAEEGKINISVKSDKKLLSYIEIPVRYTASAEVKEFYVEPYNMKYINKQVGRVVIKNNCIDNKISGEIKFNSPTYLSRKINSVKFHDIPAKGEKTVTFVIPEDWEDTMDYSMNAEVIYNTGEKETLEGKLQYCAMTYTNKPPVIDGKIEAGEWNSRVNMSMHNEAMTKEIVNYGGESDLSGDAQLVWDKDNLYLMCKARDNVFCQTDNGNGIWRGDCIQFGVTYNDSSITATEIGVALVPDGSILVHRYSSEWGYASDTSVSSAKAAVVREGDYTVYELEIPWSELVPSNAPTLKSGDEINFSMLINDNDGSGRRGWIEYGSGIGQSKNPSLYVRTALIK